jgi:hypothetical protein
MINFHRTASLIAAAAAATLSASPASAQSAQATVSASIKKPLILTRKSDMSFGTILFSGSGAFSSAVSISQTGTLTCPSTFFTCSGTTSAAVYNASGNRGQVTITADSSVTLTNATSETLTMAVSAPSTVTLTNSGNPGTDFGVGGSLTLTNNTPDGVYTGAINVTANYP